MRIYISDIETAFNKVGLTLLPILIALSNVAFWSFVDNIRISLILAILGMGAFAATTGILSLYVIEKQESIKKWYIYALVCGVYIQAIIFFAFGFGIKWGSESLWFGVGAVMHLPLFYIAGIALNDLVKFIRMLPRKLLRRLNIHLIPSDVEKEDVFGYESANLDAIGDVENRLVTLQDQVDGLNSKMMVGAKRIEQESNDLLNDINHLKIEYVSVHSQLEKNRKELKKLSHLRDLSEEQVDSLLSRMEKSKIIDWAIGFLLGFFASFLVQMFSTKIPTL